MENLNIKAINIELKDKTPQEIIAWVLNIAKNPLVTTNFIPD